MTAEQWLTLVVITWAASFLVVLAAMAGSLVEHLRRARMGRRLRAGQVVEHAWLSVPVTIVILIAVLAVRFHDGGVGTPDVEFAVSPDTALQAPADAHD